MLRLAGSAMAQLAVQWLPPTKLIFDLSAMAVGLVLDIKVLVLLVNSVRRTLLPLGFTRRRLAAALVFIHPELSVVEKCGALSREV